jgi:hypothetical protein
MTKRLDVHAPSRINPGDYALTGNVFDLKYTDLEDMEIGTKPYGHCNHCGKAIRWAVEFTHTPTDEVVVFGEICADILTLSDDRTKHEMVLLKRRVANLEKEWKYKREREANFANFSINHPDVVEYLDLIKKGENYFYDSLKWSLDKYGLLTTRQVEALRTAIKRDQERAAAKLAEPVPTHPLNEGRQVLNGTILNVKVVDGYYGTEVKMLVRLEDANKVYGTLPRNIEMLGNLYEMRGKKISFSATVTRSRDDENFGYFKRPTKARIVND